MSLSLPEKAEMLSDGVDAIAQLVGGATAQSAAGVVTVIRVIIQTIKSGLDDDVTPEQIRKELAKLTVGLESNDTTADAALDEKFKG